MERLTREYKLEEGDPCSKLIETESVKRLDAMKAIVQSYDEDKDSIASGLLEVKRNADSFLSLIAPASNERPDVTIERVECQVNEVQEQLRVQEQQVLDVWGLRRTLAEYCLQYLELEQCAKEVGWSQTILLPFLPEAVGKRKDTKFHDAIYGQTKSTK